MASHLANMHRFMVQHYDTRALRILCANLQVNFDTLEGRERETKIWRLVLEAGTHRQLPQLLDELRLNYPDFFEKEGLDRTHAVAETLSDVYRFSRPKR